MAASLVLSRVVRSRSAHTCAAAVRRSLSSGVTPPSFFTRLLLKLHHYFYDVENILYWQKRSRTEAVSRYNRFFGYMQKRFGVNIGAAFYILNIKGSFRFAGESEWFHLDSRDTLSRLIRSPDRQIEDVDLGGTLISHSGLDNLIKQDKLKILSLRGCPEVDDWFLARLHVFGESLVELDLSHCSRVTEGGLAALQHLRKLQRLDISGLPRLRSPGLVQILLEEMLPHCQVTGDANKQGLIRPDRQEPTDYNDASKHTGL